MNQFKIDNSLERRINESDKLMNKYINRIPVIVEISKQNITDISLPKYKYLVPADLTIGQFLFIIRKKHLYNQ